MIFNVHLKSQQLQQNPPFNWFWLP